MKKKGLQNLFKILKGPANIAPFNLIRIEPLPLQLFIPLQERTFIFLRKKYVL